MLWDERSITFIVFGAEKLAFCMHNFQLSIKSWRLSSWKLPRKLSVVRRPINDVIRCPFRVPLPSPSHIFFLASIPLGPENWPFNFLQQSRNKFWTMTFWYTVGSITKMIDIRGLDLDHKLWTYLIFCQLIGRIFWKIGLYIFNFFKKYFPNVCIISRTKYLYLVVYYKQHGDEIRTPKPSQSM